MSFDIHFVALNSSRSNSERNKAIRAVLDRLGAKPADRHGCVVVPFAPNDSEELYCGTNEAEEPHVMFAVQGFELAHAKLVHQVAGAGELAVISVQQEAVVIVTHPDFQSRLKPEMNDFSAPTVVVRSAEEILKLVVGGYAQWKEYAGRVARHDRTAKPGA